MSRRTSSRKSRTGGYGDQVINHEFSQCQDCAGLSPCQVSHEKQVIEKLFEENSKTDGNYYIGKKLKARKILLRSLPNLNMSL